MTTRSKEKSNRKPVTHQNEIHGAGSKSFGELEAATGRSCSIGGLYTTVDRSEVKGFLKLGWVMPRLCAEDGRNTW
jgi:hypothetical protein